MTSGVATFAGCKIDKAGTGYTLTTTNGSGFANGSSSSFNITVGAATQVTLTDFGSTAGGGSRTLTATVQDAGGNTVTTDNTTQVTFNKSSGTGTATFPGAATAVNGVATATATNLLAGTMVVGATTSPVLAVNNAASYTIVLGAASQTVFTTSPGNTGGGSAFAAQPVVKVEDAGGNVITTDNTTPITLDDRHQPRRRHPLRLHDQPDHRHLRCRDLRRLQDRQGRRRLHAHHDQHRRPSTNGVSSAFNITVGAASQVTLTTSGSTAGGGSRTLTATIQDAGGNTVTTDNTTQVTFNKASGTGTATFPGAATAVNGVATATATNQLIGTMVVGATTSPVLTVNNAASYTIVLGAASQVSLTTSGSTAGGGSRTLTATIQDAGGNTVTTDNTTQVTFNKSLGHRHRDLPGRRHRRQRRRDRDRDEQADRDDGRRRHHLPGADRQQRASYTIVLGAASPGLAHHLRLDRRRRLPHPDRNDPGRRRQHGHHRQRDAGHLQQGLRHRHRDLPRRRHRRERCRDGDRDQQPDRDDGRRRHHQPVLTVNNAASYTIVFGAASQVSLTTSGSTAGGGSRTLTATDPGRRRQHRHDRQHRPRSPSTRPPAPAPPTFPAAATAVNGIATATATNQLTGTMVVGATTSPVLTVNNAASYTIVLGAASQVSLTTSGSTAGGGSRTLTATIQDAGGNTVTTDNTPRSPSTRPPAPAPPPSRQPRPRSTASPPPQRPTN